MLKQKTLVLFKPDVVQRQIVGEILTRFERKGFKIVGMKMVLPTESLAKEHYETTDEQIIGMGNKTIVLAQEHGEDTSKMDAREIGLKVWQRNVDYLSCGPILAIVMQGPHIIESVRKMIGVTNPFMADVGTIRADYSPDSITLSSSSDRTTRTMLHASDSEKSAQREIALWFKKGEIFEYETAIEKVLFDVSWSLKRK
ncbi:MAG: Nucleoside diphosphate kinase [candidate division WS6 bacterium GW2011_GWF2_39_15]|uniref:nucleoside-diphosphate kinase n=1 Tax=candidate division WS6 bacterium GW2011_GWF2_39_15 TaxID=1619100 RepID=A0A0G0Q763_9BACT|nr:MAG: Nucleoside diphosphate kinase [candidate division WS6 bacterium GW2011_GWF2_39_15]